MQEALAADRRSRASRHAESRAAQAADGGHGFSELLRGARKRVVARTYTARVDGCARSLHAIIDAIAEITKTEAQATKLNGSPVNLQGLLISLTDGTRLLVGAEIVAVVSHISPEALFSSIPMN